MTVAYIGLPLFDGMDDESGDPFNTSPVIHSDPIAFINYVNQKVDEPPALPTVSGSDSIYTPFHNRASGIASGGFQQALSCTINPNIGIRVQGGQLTASAHMVGHGTYWEEFMGLLTGPWDTTRTRMLGNDNQTPSRGRFQIAYTGGAWRFQFVQSSTTTVTFDAITVPRSLDAPEAIPVPFYCRLLREFDTTGTGTLHLVINDGTTTQIQEVTGVARHDDTISTSVYQFGVNNFPDETEDPTIEMWWHRSLSSDSFVTPGTLTGNYWSTPNLNSAVSYFSHGSDALSFIDSGTADEYWHHLSLYSNGLGQTLTMNGGGRIKVRVAATNTLPPASSSSAFTGPYFTLQNNIGEVLSDPRGRYLQLEWRYEPGSGWPLGMGSCYISRYGSPQLIGSVTHYPTAQGSNVVSLPVGGEAASGGPLPSIPDYATSMRIEARSKLSRFDAPYSVGYALGTKARRRYSVSWTLTASELATLETFFLALDGGEQAFTWTAPGDDLTSKAAMNSALSIVKLGPDAFQAAAELEEVF